MLGRFAPMLGLLAPLDLHPPLVEDILNRAEFEDTMVLAFDGAKDALEDEALDVRELRDELDTAVSVFRLDRSAMVRSAKYRGLQLNLYFLKSLNSCLQIPRLFPVSWAYPRAQSTETGSISFGNIFLNPCICLHLHRALGHV